jgi:hypothetical protein
VFVFAACVTAVVASSKSAYCFRRQSKKKKAFTGLFNMTFFLRDPGRGYAVGKVTVLSSTAWNSELTSTRHEFQSAPFSPASASVRSARDSNDSHAILAISLKSLSNCSFPNAAYR